MRDEVRVDAPPEHVFAVVADPEKLSEWMSGVKEARFGVGSRPGLGAVIVTECAFRGRQFRITHEVTQFEPPTRYAFRTVEGSYPIASAFTFRPDDGGTLITCEHDVIADSMYSKLVFTLLWPLMRRMVRRRLAWELDELADLIEGFDDGEEEDAAAGDGQE